LLIELLARKSGMTGLFNLMMMMMIYDISGVHSNIAHVQTERK